MIEIQTSNGGRGTGTVVDLDDEFVWFVPNVPWFRLMLVPVALVIAVTPT